MKNMMRFLMIAVSVLFLAGILAPAAFAAIPQKINIQGVFSPVITGVTGGYFKIWDAETNGVLIKQYPAIFYLYPQQPATQLPNYVYPIMDKNGFFNVALDVSSLPLDKPYWLQIIIGNATLPLQPLLSVPYAITAKNLVGGTINAEGDGAATIFGKRTSGKTWGGMGGYMKVGSLDAYVGAAGWANEGTGLNVGVAGTGTNFGVSGYSDYVGVYGQQSPGVGGSLGVYIPNQQNAILSTYYGVAGVANTTQTGLIQTGVYGWGKANGGMFESNDGTAVRGTSKNSFGLFMDAPKNYFSGNVGIGTSSPGTKLDIVGNGGTDWASGFISIRNPKMDAGIRLYNGNDIKFHIYNLATSNALYVVPEGNPDGGIKITQNGNVGIGTAAPSAPLEAHNSTANGAGIKGFGPTYGVYGEGTDSTLSYGVEGIGTVNGAYFYGKTGTGVKVYAPKGHGVYVDAPKNYFSGNVEINGTVKLNYKAYVTDAAGQINMTAITGKILNNYSNGQGLVNINWDKIHTDSVIILTPISPPGSTAKTPYVLSGNPTNGGAVLFIPLNTEVFYLVLNAY